ncbi:hypothetical protein BKA64DRAFT_21818 [Cadophora sp. MPI-SDFR-AT-0126]|nr:hypothetical protein BKA64DRAFT_21818 [Leotiomycetes sp. MPI-SDFR-AT-0126]
MKGMQAKTSMMHPFVGQRHSPQRATSFKNNPVKMGAQQSSQSLTAPLKRHPFPILDLPLEIRNRIYTYALSAPAGYLFPEIHSPKNSLRKSRITFDSVHQEHGLLFSSWLRDPSIALPLLQTCKQIHAEAKDYVYRCNTFVLVDFMDYREIHGWLGRRVQHIWIDQHRSDIEKGRMRNTAEALSTIHDWVLHGEGPLRTLTISVCGSQSHFNDLVHDFFFDRSRFDEVAKMLYNSWHGKQGDWGGVRRKIEAWAGN